MKIDLSILAYKNKIELDSDVVFDKSYFENSVIKNLKKVHVFGYFYQNEVDEYKCELEVKGIMEIEDSVNLDLLDYEFNFVIDDNLDEFLENNQNILDIIELLWQNIVLEVPIRYTKCDAKNLEGENWKVINGKSEDIDPRMQKLYDYYKGGE